MPETPKVQFLISNLSLPKHVLVAGLSPDYERYLRSIGADGIELTPTKISRFVGRLLGRAEMIRNTSGVSLTGREGLFDLHGYDIRKDWTAEDARTKRIVRSLHSSFRDEVGDNGVVARTMPTWRESLEQMRAIQTITGLLPAVLYPRFRNTGTVLYDSSNAPFAARGFQPTKVNSEGMGLTNDTDVQTVLARMNSQGLTEVIADTFHSPPDLVQELAANGLVLSVHLAVNRLDMTGFRGKAAKATRAARRAFIHSADAARQTPEGQMLEGVARAWAEQPSDPSRPWTVVLEDGPFRFGNVERDQAAMIANARQIVADAFRSIL